MPADDELTGSEKLIRRIRSQVEDPDEYGPTLEVSDLDRIFDVYFRYRGDDYPENVQLLSMWIRGQPAPDTVAAQFLVREGSLVGEIVEALLGKDGDRLQLRVIAEKWPGGSHGVGVYTPNIPYPGGQPTPDAIPRKS